MDYNTDISEHLGRLLGPKTVIFKSRGVLRDEIIEKGMTRLIDDGYAVQRDGDLELTSEGNALYKRMTSRCPKTEYRT